MSILSVTIYGPRLWNRSRVRKGGKKGGKGLHTPSSKRSNVKIRGKEKECNIFRLSTSLTLQVVRKGKETKKKRRPTSVEEKSTRLSELLLSKQRGSRKRRRKMDNLRVQLWEVRKVQEEPSPLNNLGLPR